ncbi:MAG: hypothetical protein RhofKO_04950 [Rhodothermales bacterium]
MLRIALLSLLVLSGCAAGGHRIEVKLDRSNPEPLLRYYFGAYAAADTADPFEAGLLANDGDRYWLNVEGSPHAEGLTAASGGDGVLDWEELKAFVAETYYATRNLPLTTYALYASLPADSSAWFTVEVDGVMTVARRRIQVPEAALRSALEHYQANDQQLLYPIGTAFVATHTLDGTLVETTLMQKRADGLWDFATYDADGNLATSTTTEPKPLQTPTQCVGCHFGNRAFEPEKSFPEPARDGPHGPRAVYVPEAWRDPALVAFFDEHQKRSDTVLGIYNTLFVAKLRASGEDAELLRAVGL